MTDELKEFLSRKDIKEALFKNDLKYCFDLLLNKIKGYFLIKEFNKLLMESKVNSLDYIDRIYPYQFNASKIENITIPKNIKIIGDSAFANCADLKSVTIPYGVKSIGAWAFSCCADLTNVTIGKSVTEIGYGAFYRCDGLTSVTIGKSVKRIGSYAFAFCSKLNDVTIPEKFKNSLPEIFGNNHSSINFKFI